MTALSLPRFVVVTLLLLLADDCIGMATGIVDAADDDKSGVAVPGIAAVNNENFKMTEKMLFVFLFVCWNNSPPVTGSKTSDFFLYFGKDVYLVYSITLFFCIFVSPFRSWQRIQRWR